MESSAPSVLLWSLVPLSAQVQRVLHGEPLNITNHRALCARGILPLILVRRKDN